MFLLPNARSEMITPLPDPELPLDPVELPARIPLPSRGNNGNIPHGISAGTSGTSNPAARTAAYIPAIASRATRTT